MFTVCGIPRRVGRWAALMVGLTAALAGGAVSALDFQDVEHMVQQQLPEQAIINLAATDPTLRITDAEADRLRSLGASENLVAALRPRAVVGRLGMPGYAQPPSVTPMSPLPPSVQAPSVTALPLPPGYYAGDEEDDYDLYADYEADAPLPLPPQTGVATVNGIRTPAAPAQVTAGAAPAYAYAPMVPPTSAPAGPGPVRGANPVNPLGDNIEPPMDYNGVTVSTAGALAAAPYQAPIMPPRPTRPVPPVYGPPVPPPAAQVPPVVTTGPMVVGPGPQGAPISMAPVVESRGLPPRYDKEGWLSIANRDWTPYYLQINREDERLFLSRFPNGGIVLQSGQNLVINLPKDDYKLYGESGERLEVKVRENETTLLSLEPVGVFGNSGLNGVVQARDRVRSEVLFNNYVPTVVVQQQPATVVVQPGYPPPVIYRRPPPRFGGSFYFGRGW